MGGVKRLLQARAARGVGHAEGSGRATACTPLVVGVYVQHPLRHSRSWCYARLATVHGKSHEE